MIKTLFMIGNGFDISQGLQTRYTDFYNNYFHSIKNEKLPCLKKMQEQIAANIETWADMELAFGKFTSEIETLEEFQDFHEFLCEHLQKYLTEELRKYEYTQESHSRIVKGLTEFTNLLDRSEINCLEQRYNISQDVQVVNIMNFNYTDIIENNLNSSKEQNPSFLGTRIQFGRIEHVHETLGKTIILGVDNSDQIANNKFKDDPIVNDYIIKTQCNQGLKTDNTAQCESLIHYANIIILFGLSLGETDSHWWRKIGEALCDPTINTTVIYFAFVKGKEWDATKRNRLIAKERELRNMLYHKFEIPETEDKAKMDSQIIIQIDKPLFNQ